MCMHVCIVLHTVLESQHSLYDCIHSIGVIHIFLLFAVLSSWRFRNIRLVTSRIVTFNSYNI